MVQYEPYWSEDISLCEARTHGEQFLAVQSRVCGDAIKLYVGRTIAVRPFLRSHCAAWNVPRALRS